MISTMNDEKYLCKNRTISKENLIECDDTDKNYLIPRKSLPIYSYKAQATKIIRSSDVKGRPPIILKGQVFLKSLNKNDLIFITDMCEKCQSENSKKPTTKKYKEIQKHLSRKKCFLYCIYFAIINIVSLLIFYACIPNHDKIVQNTIDESTINRTNYNLINFKPRTWGKSDYCTYQNPIIKSKIRFIITKTSLLECSHPKVRDDHCLSIIKEDFLQFWKNSGSNFNDIYYNYMMTGYERSIYEGRSLFCQFDEEFLIEDHSSMITVGIEYCYSGYSEINSYFTLGVTDTVNNFIVNLEESSLLTNDYILEFPDLCKDSFLVQRIQRIIDPERILFYNSDYLNLLNISTVWNQSVIKNLLFSPDNNIESNPNYDKYSVISPFSINDPIRINNENQQLININILSVRFFMVNFGVLKDGEEISKALWESENNFNIKYRDDITDLFGDEFLSLEECYGNYFTFMGSDIIQSEFPSENIKDLDFSKSVLNIIIILDGSNNISYGDQILFLSESVKSITKDTEKRISFSNVDIQFACSTQPNDRFISHTFKYLVDVTFSEFISESGRHETYKSKCLYM